MRTSPVARIVAGSYSGGGAGIQADLETSSALGAYGTSVITALTAQNTRGTGCTLFSAIAALRSQCASWPQVVIDAKQWRSAALAAADARHVGHGHGPAHHFHLGAQWS